MKRNYKLTLAPSAAGQGVSQELARELAKKIKISPTISGKGSIVFPDQLNNTAIAPETFTPKKP